MKRIFTVGLISPAALFLVFGTAAVAYGQKEQEKEAKPEKAPQEQRQQAKPAQKAPQRAQQEPKQQAKPATQRAQQEPKQQAKPATQRAQQEPKQQAKPAQQVKSTPARASNAVPERSQQQARGWQQQRGWLQQGGGWQGNNSWQQGRASAWQSQHRTWAERGGYGGYYIPDATFTLDFGDQHWFRITSQPTIVGGYPRFRQDGFWFMMVDPWPESWAENWYATDDVYVGYNDGYYLYNRRDPGDAIAISIVL